MPHLAIHEGGGKSNLPSLGCSWKSPQNSVKPMIIALSEKSALGSLSSMKKPAAFDRSGLLNMWCRRDESNTRPSHYEFSPAGKSELYRNNSDCKSLSPLKFPHSALKVGATQPPAKRSMSVPELCRADQRAVPAKSRGPPVPAATRDKARHSSFACFGAAKRDIGLISPQQIFSRSAH